MAVDERRATGWSIRRRVAVWLVGSVVGVTLIALPDADDRVFSLSRTHGPSPVDLLGTAILVAAWLPVPAVIWTRRRTLDRRSARAPLVLGVVGAVALAVAVGLDLGPIYLVPAAMLLVAQLLVLRVLARGGG